MKRSSPLTRGKGPKRGKPPRRSTKRIKFGNAYTQPEILAQSRRVRKRAGGLCEAQVRCGGNPIVGLPHHLRYDERFKGKKRVLVPDEDVIGCCRDCHLWYEQENRVA